MSQTPNLEEMIEVNQEPVDQAEQELQLLSFLNDLPRQLDNLHKGLMVAHQRILTLENTVGFLASKDPELVEMMKQAAEDIEKANSEG